MHWETHGLWTSNLITSTMSCNRFQIISAYLHVGDPSSSDKISRIREISLLIQQKSMELYKPRKSFSIDESMIGFNCKHSMKQYLPRKPTRWGFKAFLLSESKTGYCLKHKFFEGKGFDEFKPKRVCSLIIRGVRYSVSLDQFTYFKFFEQQ